MWESGTVSHVKTEVGALAQNQGSITIKGGLFTNNTATQTWDKDDRAGGGAVIWSSKGSVSISGGEFSNNTAGTGGAIVSCDNLIISGGTFSNNKATRTDGIRGGGAIYADNKLTISGGRFKDNLSYRNGGAVFLDFDSTATISGGVFEGNACGYADLGCKEASGPTNNTGMGGAIYTEESTTTYMAWTAAYENTAGHFGGGLWFCPSGIGKMESGGGIALFDNDADVAHDPRNSTFGHASENGTGAGDDFAIMWPTKGEQHNPEFTLSHAWFTGVETKVYADGGTKSGEKEGADGFDDTRLAVDYGPKNDEDKGGYPRYVDGSNKNELYEKSRVIPKDEGAGVGLKVIANPADGNQGQAKEDAKAQAEVRVFNNHARLSGGGIGSNGNIVFSRFYKLTWSKKDADTSKILGGSAWQLTGPDGDASLTVPVTDNEGQEDYAGSDIDARPGYFCVVVGDTGTYTLKETKAPEGYKLNEDGHTVTVYAKNDTREFPFGSIPNKSKYVLTWKKVDAISKDPLAGSTWTLEGETSGKVLTVVDNGENDVDSTDGSFKVFVDDPDEYVLCEKTAPAGYSLSKTMYRATVNDTHKSAAFGVLGEGGKIDPIPNERAYSLSWIKVKAGSPEEKLPDSWWSFKKAKDEVWQTVKDNMGQDDYEGLDEDPDPGEFKVSVTETGCYMLYELKAPAGYDKIDTTFSACVSDESPNPVFADEGEDTISNAPTPVVKSYELVWDKVDETTNKPLDGSGWRITGPNGESIEVVDNDKNDEDPAVGSFKVTVNTAGEYALVETKAPDGYEKIDAEFKVTVSDGAATGRFGGEAGIPNSQTPPDSSTINIPVEKIWADGNNQDGLRPTSVTVRLYANGVATDKTVTLNAENGWKASFDDLAKKDESGTDIEYAIKEDPAVPGYQVAITGNVTEGFKLTNSHTPEETEVSGSKTWDDADNKDGIRPDSITIHLLANGVEVASKVVTAEDAWSWSFGDLPKYQNGVEIVYTIVEDPVPGYDCSVDGFDVRNTHTPKPPTENPPDDNQPPTDENPPDDNNPPSEENPPSEDNPPENTPPTDEPELPRTGDQSLPTGVLAVMAAAGVGLIALGASAVRRRG